LVKRLRAQGREVEDLGTDSDAACDYPEFASAVGNAVRSDPGSLGILVCATGQGMAIAAGKVRGIRPVVPTTVEAARLSRFDNNANVLCLAGRLLPETEAFAIVDTWLATGFAGGRHARRIAKVAAMETASAVAFVTESERLCLATMGVPARIFDRDPSLFAFHGSSPKAIKSSLDWLSLAADMTARLPELSSFIEEIRKARYKDLIVLLEDGEESPTAATIRLWASGGLRLHIMSRADRSAVLTLEKSVHFGTALVLSVARANACPVIEGKEQLLWAKVLDLYSGDAKRAGGHFAAIAPPKSRLAGIAQTHLYRKVFVDAAEIGEGFCALGLEGLLPAALFGMDPARILARATATVEACRKERLEDNPGANLGVLLGAMAKHGRSKLTLLASKSLLSLGPWIAQVLSSATGANYRRIVTLWDEPLLPSYPPDRIFVHLQAEDDPPAVLSDRMEALHLAGQPYIQITLHDRYELAGELFRWEFAATIAALVLGTCPCVPTATTMVGDQEPQAAAPT
jgi:RpiB/LacA/LacB family sugar-phosphate isomerase